ncbi:hypothetical protein [Bosea lathyri]|uniref:Uncharacterized protein n=1 Tax=Bosea lathyri TaxID=1036778 RepID=A0A1H6BKD4_9HYPH|nr:hypothetical protein [Bosea lathyri]SEG61143.1 hypothetical protein SAMN04488115_107312 [Bosea lathyri]
MPAWLHGRPLWYVAPAVGLLAALVQPWPVAASLAVTYLLWGLFAWGRWFDLGRLPIDPFRPIDALERAIGAVSGGSDHLALFLRHVLILPGLALVGFVGGEPWLSAVAPFFAALVVALYEAAWRLSPTAPIILAEIGVGLLWGALILLV